MFTKSNQKIIFLSKKGRILNINPAACIFFQVKEKEILNEEIWNLNFWNEIHIPKYKIEEKINLALDKGSIQVESILPYHNKETHKFLICISSIFDDSGDFLYLLCVGEETEKFKSQTRTILKSNEYYSSLFYLFDQPIMVGHPTKGFISGNPEIV